MSRDAPRDVIAVIRAPDPERAELLAVGLARGGVPAIEITMTVPDAPAVLRRLAGLPARIGAGTVLDVDACDVCVEAGATFLVAPDTNADVIDRARQCGVAIVPGALTPTEIHRAHRLGADAVKVFPISAVGGSSYVRAVREPLPDIPLVVSGGIRSHEVGAYVDAGAHAVCLGRELIDADALAAGDVDAIAAHARRVLAGTPFAGPSTVR